MSKDITIKEGGTAKSLTGIKRVRTDLAEGSTAGWVPEDETVLTTMGTTANGEYVASADNFYGYSKVTVLVDGGGGAEVNGVYVTTIGTEGSGIIGRGSDGKTYLVRVVNGTLVRTEVTT